MQKRLPPLDLIRGFEAAARHLSFTRAAEELFLTQSAVSRQIQTLEEHLGVRLFQRRHRALLLTDEGQVLHRAAVNVLRDLQAVMEQISGQPQTRMVTVTAMLTFSSLWLVPRLAAFRKAYPGIDVRIAADNEVLDLDRSRIDVAIRYLPKELAPPGAPQLFAEEVLPMCSPKLLRDKTRPLKTPADLRHHVLLHDHDPEGRTPWLDWATWFQSQGFSDVQQAGELRFSHYDQMIQAAVAGQGVALGRLPLMRSFIRNKQLVAPFEPRLLPGKRPQSSRAFYVVRSARANRPEVDDFSAWLRQEARRDEE